MAANKKMLAQFMLGDKVMSLALFVLGIAVDSHTVLSLSLSFSLPETALSIAVAVFVTSGQESMYDFYNVYIYIYICNPPLNFHHRKGELMLTTEWDRTLNW